MMVEVKKYFSKKEREKINQLEGYLNLIGFNLKDGYSKREIHHFFNIEKMIHKYTYKSDRGKIVISFYIYKNAFYRDKIEVETMLIDRYSVYNKVEFISIEDTINWILENI